MSPEEERWAEAMAVYRQHGQQAGSFVAERIGSLAHSNDYAGVQRWKDIAAKLDRIVRAPKQ